MEHTMSTEIALLGRLYDHFNARDMEAALATMRRDVVWANGIEGGYVHGHDGVRDYWTRQWATIDSHADPVSFSKGEDGAIDVEVRLTARDSNGSVVFDKVGVHAFQIEHGLITRFDIRPIAV
jgi:hypothetical protein